MARNAPDRMDWKQLVGVSLLVGVALAAPVRSQPNIERAGTVIRLLVPPGGLVEGRTEIETLSMDPDIRQVIFLLDGTEVGKRNRAPFNAKVPFADPPREQTLAVEAYGARDRLLGRDVVQVNRPPIPLRVQITALERDAEANALAVAATVSVPRKAALERLDFYFNEDLKATAMAPPFEARFEIPPASQGDFARVVAMLRDGRIVEDVEVIGEPFSDEVDVNLVQLQVLVTKRSGAPVTDLEQADFEVLEAGKVRQIDRLYPAEGVSLVLGLVLDSSGSMVPIWDLTVRSAGQFLQRTVKERDRAFLVDFDTRLSLVQSLTADVEELITGMDEIVPDGGTALYDSILFSMLQFTDEPGRRALVVLTDGVDASSTSNPKRAVEFGRKLGVPVYIVALPWPERGARAGAAFARSYSSQELKLLTDPTGGRLIRTGSADGIARAFSQINTELRHQYVLTFYSAASPGSSDRPPVVVRLKGRKDVEVRAVVATDLIQ